MYTIHVIVANLVRLSDTNKSNNELNTQYFSSAKGGGGGGGAQGIPCRHCMRSHP